MSTAARMASDDEKPDLRQRAKEARQSASAVLTGTPANSLLLTICAAGRLGEMLAEAWDRMDALDAQITPQNREVLRIIEDGYMRHIRSLETAISFARATSPAGMLAQLAVAASAVDLASSGSNYAVCAAASEQAERCLYSVVAALCAMTGVDRERYATSRYLSTASDKLAVLTPEVA